MKITKVEEETEEKEKEDVVKGMEKKTSDTLKHKRSFFVRMVSDPKLYNPKIVKVCLKKSKLVLKFHLG